MRGFKDQLHEREFEKNLEASYSRQLELTTIYLFAAEQEEEDSEKNWEKIHQENEKVSLARNLTDADN